MKMVLIPVLTLCIAEFVRKCSWLYKMKFTNENMNSHEGVKSLIL
jgi:hypothetical protein